MMDRGRSFLRSYHSIAYHVSVAHVVVPYRALLDRWVVTSTSLSNFSCADTMSGLFLDYPHWEMKPELKRYYLMQAAYWCQQLLVLILRLEKPRKDYNELVAHHLVTLWLIG